jgi:hypothetical protein
MPLSSASPLARINSAHPGFGAYNLAVPAPVRLCIFVTATTYKATGSTVLLQNELRNRDWELILTQDTNREGGNKSHYSSLFITAEDTKEWRQRTQLKKANVVSWLRVLFQKLDPPRAKIALSTFRWTRADTLIAGVSLIVTLFWFAPHPEPATRLYHDAIHVLEGGRPQAATERETGNPVEVVGLPGRASKEPIRTQKRAAVGARLIPGAGTIVIQDKR